MVPANPVVRCQPQCSVRFEFLRNLVDDLVWGLFAIEQAFMGVEGICLLFRLLDVLKDTIDLGGDLFMLLHVCPRVELTCSLLQFLDLFGERFLVPLHDVDEQLSLLVQVGVGLHNIFI